MSVRRATAADRPMVERLWLMFRHDMSEFGGQLPNPDGTFRTERLVAAFEDRDWAGYVIAGPQDRPAGFAIVRASPAQPVSSTASSWCGRCGGPESGGRLWALSSPSIPARGGCVPGCQRCRRVLLAPGRDELAGSDWTEERRPVPGQPDVPPDVWISFTAARVIAARVI